MQLHAQTTLAATATLHAAQALATSRATATSSKYSLGCDSRERSVQLETLVRAPTTVLGSNTRLWSAAWRRRHVQHHGTLSVERLEQLRKLNARMAQFSISETLLTSPCRRRAALSSRRGMAASWRTLSSAASPMTLNHPQKSRVFLIRSC
jgi:hypothetical protein